MEKLLLSVVYAALMCAHHKNKSDVKAFESITISDIQRVSKHKLLVFGMYTIEFRNSYSVLQIRADNTYSLDVIDRGQELLAYILTRFPEPMQG